MYNKAFHHILKSKVMSKGNSGNNLWRSGITIRIKTVLRDTISSHFVSQFKKKYIYRMILV